jgi:uncharacterized protein YndB with AHSA1/START domain
VRYKVRFTAPVDQVWALLSHPEALYWHADDCVLTLTAPADLLPNRGELTVFVRRQDDGNYGSGVVETEVVQPLRHMRRFVRSASDGATFDMVLGPARRGADVTFSASRTTSSSDWMRVIARHQGHLRRMARRLADSLETGPQPGTTATDYLCPNPEVFGSEVAQTVEIAASAEKVMALIDRPDDPSGLSPNNHVWFQPSAGVDLVGWIRTVDEGVLQGSIQQRIRSGAGSVILQNANAQERYELVPTSTGVTLRLTQRRAIMPGIAAEDLALDERELGERTLLWMARIKEIAEATS